MICYLFGHRFNDQALSYGVIFCEWCNKEFQDGGYALTNLDKFGVLGYPWIIFKQKYYRMDARKWIFWPRCWNCGKRIFIRHKKYYCCWQCREEDSIPF